MPPVIAQTVFGPMLIPPFDAYVGQALIRMGQYSPAEFSAWRPYLKPGSVVVDAGANVGAHTMAFASVVGFEGVVLAFEPQRHLYQMLCGSIELCGAYNVRPRNAALGREVGTVRVPHLDYDAPQNFGALSLADVAKDAPTELVPCMPLDGLGLTRLDFLKIDVEGAELSVLHGAKETLGHCRPIISAEADREQNTPALLALLRLNGYRVWWHKPPLGPFWPRIVSINLLALPRERDDLPLPTGDVEVAIE